MKSDRGLDSTRRRIDREKQNRVLDVTPGRADGRDLDMSFDGTHLRVKYAGFWYHFDAPTNNWIKEV